MSYRAIQRLREERECALRDDKGSDNEEDEDDALPARAKGFAASFIDDSSSSSDGESEVQEVDTFAKRGFHAKVIDDEPSGSDGRKALTVTIEENEEDLDELITRFKEQDDDEPQKVESISASSSWFEILTSSIDLRDLDFDYVMRNSLHGGGDGGQSSRAGSRRSKQSNIFGPPKDGWPRPPRYIGGGIGMVTYENSPRQLPWPYSDLKSGDERCAPDSKCFSFQYSDSYQWDCKDYETVQMSGDINMVALFLAHHPWFVPSLICLATVLYQTGQSQEGLVLIQRALWVYECCFLHSFIKKTFGFMDHDLPENQPFFETLFRMVRISHVAGLPKAALAYSKLLLSLDPLRDPKNVLLVIDHFVMLANTKEDDEWLVDFLEKETISIFQRDEFGTSENECRLLSLPNMAYSYALARYRIFIREKNLESERKAKDAMKNAILSFPSVFYSLLSKNEIDISSARFQNGLKYTNDRSTLILNTVSSYVESTKEIQARITQAYDLIVRIFVDANHKHWFSTNINDFMLACIEALIEDQREARRPLRLLNPVLLKYSNCDPINFVDIFPTMPAEANPLDRGLVAHAMRVEINRPRFMQRAAQGVGEDQIMEMVANAQQRGFAGPPTEMIDPDLPLLEIFWRSALPWAHVEGVERPPE